MLLQKHQYLKQEFPQQKEIVYNYHILKVRRTAYLSPIRALGVLDGMVLQVFREEYQQAQRQS